MLKNVKVNLRQLVTGLNMPTVLKTAVLPGDSAERLFIATQVGEIFYIGDGAVETFLDIRHRIIRLGASGGGYDERGLLGLAFHPGFRHNGLFYIHFSLVGTQGPGAFPGSFRPDPCDPGTLGMKWINRESQFDHIDTVEEWVYQPNSLPGKRRTLLNIRRPFMNHNGFNSLNFSPETGRLVLTTGDGGAGYDPFNLSQDNMEIAGKIIEIDVSRSTLIENLPVATRFDELPAALQEMLSVSAKGVRNIPGIAFQRSNNRLIKYVGNVGQDLVESVYSFENDKPIPVAQLIQDSSMGSGADQDSLINFGWRGWEGIFPSPIIRVCPADQSMDEKIVAYYDEAIMTSLLRLQPLTCYYHQDPRPDKFAGTALTGVQPYMGSEIPDLTGKVVFTDLVRKDGSQASNRRGVLAYTTEKTDCVTNDFSVIETDYDFGTRSAYYVGLGTNIDQTRLYLGVYGSTRVTNFNQGTVFEIVS